MTLEIITNCLAKSSELLNVTDLALSVTKMGAITSIVLRLGDLGLIPETIESSTGGGITQILRRYNELLERLGTMQERTETSSLNMGRPREWAELLILDAKAYGMRLWLRQVQTSFCRRSAEVLHVTLCSITTHYNDSLRDIGPLQPPNTPHQTSTTSPYPGDYLNGWSSPESVSTEVAQDDEA